MPSGAPRGDCWSQRAVALQVPQADGVAVVAGFATFDPAVAARRPCTPPWPRGRGAGPARAVRVIAQTVPPAHSGPLIASVQSRLQVPHSLVAVVAVLARVVARRCRSSRHSAPVSSSSGSGSQCPVSQSSSAAHRLPARQMPRPLPAQLTADLGEHAWQPCPCRRLATIVDRAARELAALQLLVGDRLVDERHVPVAVVGAGVRPRYRRSGTTTRGRRVVSRTGRSAPGLHRARGRARASG